MPKVTKKSLENLRPARKGEPSRNPLGAPKAMLRYRNLLQSAITEDDFNEIIALLLKKAKKGERWAILEVLDRTLGKDFHLTVGTDEKLLGVLELIAGFKGNGANADT